LVNTFSYLLFKPFGSFGKYDEPPPEKSFALKPYAKHILSMHIRRQYQALYRLYLEQLIIQRKNCSDNAELEELSEIASNIKDYSASLPGLKGITTLSLAALTVIGTLFGIFDVKVQFVGFLIQILLLGIAIVFTMGIISPYISAFYFKRFLFKGKNPSEALYAPDEVAKQLYASSIYKLEDILFESLGGKKRKPQEVPIDVYLHMGSFVLYVVFAALTIQPTIFGLNVETIAFIGLEIIFTGFMVYFGFILPLRDYRYRRFAKLH